MANVKRQEVQIVQGPYTIEQFVDESLEARRRTQITALERAATCAACCLLINFLYLFYRFKTTVGALHGCSIQEGLVACVFFTMELASMRKRN